MIQKGTYLNITDNSGGKIALCIYNVTHPKCRYAFIGDLLLVSIKKLRIKRRYASKIKKGALVYGLVIRTKVFKNIYFGDKVKFYENSIILFYRKTFNLIGTKIFGLLPRLFRYTQYTKLLSVSAGISF